MIAKCIAILAIVAQINASICGCGPSSVVLPSSGCFSQSGVLAASGSSGVLVASGSSGVLAASGSSLAPVTRNIVASGKYPVALSSSGPVSSQQIPVTTTQVTAPLQEKPTVRLPAQIPAPRTVSHTCTCFKTILKPRVQQQIITVPTVQRYVETLHKPVVENIQYEAVPVNCNGIASSFGGISGFGGSPIQAIQVPSLGASCAQSVSPVQLVEVPQPVSLGCASSCFC